jgi:hypothetical protein
MNSTLLRPVLAGLAGLALLGLTTARADQQVSAEFAMALRLNAVVNSADCMNSGGPEVSLGGDITLDGIKLKLIFKNNTKGTHTAVVVKESSVTLLPLGSKLTIPKQPVRGGVGGNPHIYLQFHDGKGNLLSEEFYLGRCVQGLTLSPELINAALARATLHTEGCSNKGGPYITLNGDLTLGGLHARFIVEGSTITLPKQPVKGGVGGNPIIGIQFLEGDGTPITQPVDLGRCNTL